MIEATTEEVKYELFRIIAQLDIKEFEQQFVEGAFAEYELEAIYALKEFVRQDRLDAFYGNARIRAVPNGWKILGYGTVYETYEDALRAKYGSAESNDGDDLTVKDIKDASDIQPPNPNAVVSEPSDIPAPPGTKRPNGWTIAYVSKKRRDSMKSEDFGWPEEKKYPVPDEAHFRAAVRLLGRAPTDKQAMIKRNLIRIAKRRGWALPESWQ